MCHKIEFLRKREKSFAAFEKRKGCKSLCKDQSKKATLTLSRSTWSQSLWKAVGASDNYSSQAALAGGESISSISIIVVLVVLATLEVLVVLVVLVVCWRHIGANIISSGLLAPYLHVSHYVLHCVSRWHTILMFHVCSSSSLAGISKVLVTVSE